LTNAARTSPRGPKIALDVLTGAYAAIDDEVCEERRGVRTTAETGASHRPGSSDGLSS
jgi:hypothetical protein